MKIKIIWIAILLSCLLNIPTYAQDAATKDKRALIKELISVINSKSMMDGVMKASFTEMESQLAKNLEMAIAQNLPESKKSMVQNELQAIVKRISTKFQQQFAQKVDLLALTVETVTPIYEKNFNADELKQLLSFYQSNVGKKITELLPLITQETLQQTNQKIMPIVMQIMPEIMEGEKQALDKLMQQAGTGAAPPPRVRTSKRK
jgi:uncharacterized protein